MSAINFDDLIRHLGHKIEVVTYGSMRGLAWDNVSVECIDCNEVLLSYERED